MWLTLYPEKVTDYTSLGPAAFWGLTGWSSWLSLETRDVQGGHGFQSGQWTLRGDTYNWHLFHKSISLPLLWEGACCWFVTETITTNFKESLKSKFSSALSYITHSTSTPLNIVSIYSSTHLSLSLIFLNLMCKGSSERVSDLAEVAQPMGKAGISCSPLAREHWIQVASLSRPTWWMKTNLSVQIHSNVLQPFPSPSIENSSAPCDQGPGIAST